MLFDERASNQWLDKRKSLALPVSERDRHYRRVRELMERDGMDCLVLYSIGASATNNKFEANIRYLTGEFHKTLYADEFLVFPRKGEPCFIPTSPFQVEHIKQTWVKEIKVPKDSRGQEIQYGDDQSQLLSTLVEAIFERGYETGVIGFPRDILPVYAYEQLATALPKATLADCSRLMVEARRVKSEFEIRLQKESARIADLAIKRCREVIHDGVLEHQIVAEWDHVLKLHGCEKSYELITSDPVGPACVHWPQRPKQIRTGDVITTEVSPCFGGYFTQLNRGFAVGRPHPSILELEHVCREAHLAGADKLRPGVPVGEVARTIEETVKKAGYKTIVRTGHASAGLDLPEIGMRVEDQTPLEPGVVVILHPSAVVHDYEIGKPGYFSPGDTYVITEEGADRLNTLPQDLIIIE